MEKEAEGIYLIHGFNSDDEEIFCRPSKTQSLVGARDEGKKLEDEGAFRNFMVTRVLHNSDPAFVCERWMTR